MALIVIGIVCWISAYGQNEIEVGRKVKIARGGIVAVEVKREGEELYTPTRLEWLAVEINSSISTIPIPAGIMLKFKAGDGNTLNLHVNYLPVADRAQLNLIVNMVKGYAITLAEARGWNTWMRIEEKVEMGDISDIAK